MTRDVDDETSRPRASGIRDESPATRGPTAELEEEPGGDPPCWLHLFCPDCGVEVGVVEHRAQCQLAAWPVPERPGELAD